MFHRTFKQLVAAGASTPLRINVPVALAIFLIFLGSQTFGLLGLYDSPISASDQQFFVLWMGVLAHAVFGLMALMLALGWISARASPFQRALVWTAALALSTLFFWEAVAYNMVGLHLTNTARLLWENVFTDKQIMRERMGTLLAIVGAYLFVLLGGTISGAVLERRWKALAWNSTVKPICIAAFVSLGVTSALQVVFRFAITPRVYHASVERLLCVGKLWQSRDAVAGAIFEIQAAWFHPPPRPETHALDHLPRPASNSLPDIFIIVSDSVRRDVVTPEIAPHLSAFERTCLPIQKSVANANGTHPSLTAIIHGLHPLYHGVYFRRDDYPGALPLRVLKKLGYEINVLASPDLEYFKFALAALGKDHALADFYLDQKSFVKGKTKSAGEVDRLIVKETMARLSAPRVRPRLFFVLLDSTHFEYSWPPDFEPPFKPYVDRVPAVPMRMSPGETKALRNRYQNSVAYVDSLMGDLLSAVRKSGRMDETIFVFTGDHGEEFLERGHLFHGGELNHYQLEVPLLMHFPRTRVEPWPDRIPLASHVDIFPTIFDFIRVSGDFTNSLSGHSLLGSDSPRWVVSIISAFGKKWFPMEMAVDTGDRKLMLQFVHPRVIGRSLFAERVIGTRIVDAKDNEIAHPKQRGIPAAFEEALEKVIVTKP